MYTKTDQDEYQLKREQAQRVSFAKMQEIMQRNIDKTLNRTYMHYNKELLKMYTLNPDRNLPKIIEVSRFLERHSMLYKKMIMYYASMYMFRYNIVQEDNFDKDDYLKTLKRMSKFDIAKYGYSAIYDCVRDGMYVGYVYDSGEDGIFFMPLDIAFIRIYGKTPEGQWICYFDAQFFDKDNNIDYISAEVGGWDEVFKQGYLDYKEDPVNNRWFRLPPEKTFCMLAVEDSMFTTPLPFWMPLFKSLLDLLDLEDVIQDKNVLENYKLIVNKIPLLSGSDNVDDFAISLELAQQFEKALEAVVPELVGCALLPGTDIDTVTFESSTSTTDTDTLNTSIENLFSNAGASRLVVASGSSTNSVGLKFSVQNDMANVWFFVEQYEHWLNYFIKTNISDGYEFYIHQIAWYLQDDFISQKKDMATLGLATPMEVMSATHKTPYLAYSKLLFEQNLGIYDMLRAVESSYNSSSGGTVGRPESSDEDLSDEGQATRDGNKNDGTKAANG